jgi:hypothetical protein
MRACFAALFVLCSIVCQSIAATDFSGNWAIDLKASTSPDALLKRLHIPFIQRRLAGSIQIEAVYKQTAKMLVIVARGPGFSRTEQLSFNGPPESRTEELTGPYTLQSRWSPDGAQLVTTYNFRTKDGKNASLVSKRKLSEAGASLVLTNTMHVEGESQNWVVRRVWRKRGSS